MNQKNPGVAYLPSNEALDNAENALSPAFPCRQTQALPDSTDLVTWLNPGLSKRELFALVAMHAVIGKTGTPSNKTTYEAYMQQAVLSADTLLDQLERNPKAS